MFSAPEIEDTRAEYDRLREAIARHQISYFEGVPEISDAEYDKLRAALNEMDSVRP